MKIKQSKLWKTFLSKIWKKFLIKVFFVCNYPGAFRDMKDIWGFGSFCFLKLYILTQSSPAPASQFRPIVLKHKHSMVDFLTTFFFQVFAFKSTKLHRQQFIRRPLPKLEAKMCTIVRRSRNVSVTLEPQLKCRKPLSLSSQILVSLP